MASERARPRAPPFIDPPGYVRHRPEATLLYELVERHYPELAAAREAAARPLPKYVHEEFEAYLKCGRLEHGFLRVRCQDCHAEKLVAFSCKRRGFCPSCGARRMADSAALLADEVLPAKPIRQPVLSLPFALRFLLATDPAALTRVLLIVYRKIAGHILKKARLTRSPGAAGAVTLIQRFGSALNLNIHFHLLVLDGACLVGTEPPVFRRIEPPTEAELKTLVERIGERIGRALERRGLLARKQLSRARSRRRWPDGRSAGSLDYLPCSRRSAGRPESVFATDRAGMRGGAEERGSTVRRVLAARRDWS